MKPIRINLLISALLICTLFSCSNEKHLPPPNIVWLVSEDNCPYIGIYGDTIAQTPNIDQLAETGIVYRHAFANAPVCAPARNTIITGMYANSLGNQQMRSRYKGPSFLKYFPEYLRNAGYYTTNCSKEDYNITLAGSPWDESSKVATYKNRKPGQRFFHVQNYGNTHESSLFDSIPDEYLGFKPDQMVVPPYHPNTPDFRHDWAQYYHRIAQLDTLIGEFINDLKVQGLYDSTIVFYYSDHGGVLPRGKRYLFESGTRVPMIVHIPDMYKDLLPEKRGTFSDRIVAFVDLAPTILNMVGLAIPEYMQGQPFLGRNVPESKDYAFMFRGRMDEQYDLMHAARDRNFRYIRNYYPERVYGQYLNYLWRSRAIRDWERLYKAGELNEIQSAYWKTKPYEELYDIENDPHNVNNLAGNPQYADKLKEFREATNQWIEKIKPIDVLPEPLMQIINQDSNLYEYTKNGDFPLLRVHEVARISARGAVDDFDTLYTLTKSDNPAIAFWAIKGMAQFKQQLIDHNLMNEFRSNLHHPVLYLRLTTADVLTQIGTDKEFSELILEALNSDNEFIRLEAIHLYEKSEYNPEIMKKLREIGNDQSKGGYDKRIISKMMN